MTKTILHDSPDTFPSRADEVDVLLKAVQQQLISHIRAADDELSAHLNKDSSCPPTIQPPLKISDLANLVNLTLPSTGQGPNGLLESLTSILKHSINTFSPGFLDKLYASTNVPGIPAELILAVLNTNVHVYQVSPILTLIGKTTTKTLAQLFGLDGSRAGGVSVQGGSAANMTSIVVARNTLFPETKMKGNDGGKGLKLVLFTSCHGHYSIAKAAQACGFGSDAVISVGIDVRTGAMDVGSLESAIREAISEGFTPFYINATAGTTVLGSFDPFTDIVKVARKYGCWLHVDGSWGGSFVFSEKLKYKLAGTEMADSIAINPHKMLGVPLTCSFLLGKDMRMFQRANTLKAGYLFHEDEHHGINGHIHSADDEDDDDTEEWQEPIDLADLTLQCGRRGDSLKFFLSWQYYGTQGYAEKVDQAYEVARYFAAAVQEHPDLVLVSEMPPPCLQVCFFYAPQGKLVFGPDSLQQNAKRVDGGEKEIAKMNGRVTALISQGLMKKGFMVDYAPALEGREDVGKFLRAVVNISTVKETIEKLVEDAVLVGEEVVKKMTMEHN